MDTEHLGAPLGGPPEALPGSIDRKGDPSHLRRSALHLQAIAAGVDGLEGGQVEELSEPRVQFWKCHDLRQYSGMALLTPIPTWGRIKTYRNSKESGERSRP